MSIRIRFLATVLAIYCSLLAPLVEATSLPESVQIHGFASQGYIQTTENDFFGDSSDGGSFDFRELGINGSWYITPNLLTAVQLVSRNAGETDDGALRVDYALVNYNLVSRSDSLFGLRAGRVVNPYGFYNETRDVAFTRPSILLPQSIYFDVNRQFALSSDGVHLFAEHDAPWGSLQFQGGVVKPRTDDPDLKQGITRGFFQGDLDGRTSWIGRLGYEFEGGLVRLMVTAVDLQVEYEPGDGPVNLEAGEFSFSPLLFSAQYNAERWSLTAEYERRPVSLKKFGPLLPDTEYTGESYYLQGSYRFNSSLEGVLRYDVLIWDRDDPDGEEFAALTGIPAHRRFAKDWTVGLRWDLLPSFMLQAEYHRVDGTGWLSELENPDGFERRWDLFAVMASYRF